MSEAKAGSHTELPVSVALGVEGKRTRPEPFHTFLTSFDGSEILVRSGAAVEVPVAQMVDDLKLQRGRQLKVGAIGKRVHS
jgi:hypothetical protein